jgi:hypothetical protein
MGFIIFQNYQNLNDMRWPGIEPESIVEGNHGNWHTTIAETRSFFGLV